MESHSEILERVEAKGITLSERKARFALHFAANENKAAAARAAGYEGAHSRQCGQNLFHDPEVQKAIAEMQKYIQVENILNKQLEAKLSLFGKSGNITTIARK